MVAIVEYFFGGDGRYLNLFGILFILFISYIFSDSKKNIKIKYSLSMLLTYFLLAFFFIKTSFGDIISTKLFLFLEKIHFFANKGVEFIFGSYFADSRVFGVVFGLKILPTLVFLGALASLMMHFKIMQFFVQVIGRLVSPLFGSSGVETLCTFLNSFLGQTEAPILIKGYLKTATRSEIFTIMVGGMSTINGILISFFSHMGLSSKHLIISAIISIPGAILISKVMCPEVERLHPSHTMIKVNSEGGNIVDAISKGASESLFCILNIPIMLIAFLSFIYMVNFMLGEITPWANYVISESGCNFLIEGKLSIGYIISLMSYPFVYFLGISQQDVIAVSRLIGEKISKNEFFAFISLCKLNISYRATILATYALAGFSNFSCIGIQIGGIGMLAPEKRRLICQLGIKSVFCGALVNLLSAMIVGLFI